MLTLFETEIVDMLQVCLLCATNATGQRLTGQRLEEKRQSGKGLNHVEALIPLAS